MRLASFAHGRGEGFGVVAADHVVDLSGDVPTLRAALAAWGLEGLRERARAGGRPVPLGEITWRQPITDPDKILCVGLNYHAHAKEAKMPVPERPSIFVRFASSQVGHQVPVVRPHASPQFDYEAELAVVIGKAGRHIAEARALDHVAGYSCFAENSVRDWQTHSRQADAGEELRAQRRVRAVARHGGRSGPGREDGRDRATQRPRDAARQRGQHDLLRAAADRVPLDVHHAAAGRRHRHGHARRASASPARRPCGCSRAIASTSRSPAWACCPIPVIDEPTESR
jgi:hypothetical protein